MKIRVKVKEKVKKEKTVSIDTEFIRLDALLKLAMLTGSGGEAKLLGRWGEALAAAELRRKGWKILAAGYRSRFGEIDLIAATDKYLSFIEVKLRTEERFALGREAVDRRKQARLRATAELYLAEHPEEARQPRFDVAEIYAPQGTATRRPRITWLENAF